MNPTGQQRHLQQRRFEPDSTVVQATLASKGDALAKSAGLGLNSFGDILDRSTLSDKAGPIRCDMRATRTV